jgi:hypothetical protein
MRQDLQLSGSRGAGLVDVLDRVLDKGLVIAGDIKVSLAEVELLTIRIRLIVCSIDKAEQVGLDWWKYDHHLAPGKRPMAMENEALKKQVAALEKKVDALSRRAGSHADIPASQSRGAQARTPKRMR